MSTSKWSPKDDEIEEEEEEEDVTRYQDQKDAVLFAIHVSDSMLSEHEPDSDDPKKSGPPMSAVRTALECAYAVLQSRIIAVPNDMMGILLFGTENTRFPGGGFDHCYLLMDLDVPDAASIKELKTLLEDSEKWDSLMVPCGEKVSMANVLFGANQVFTTKAPNFQSRKLFLITDDDDPHADDKALKNSAITRARDLYDLGVTIDPFYISNPGRKEAFDPGKFYDDIIYRSAFEDDDDKPLPLTGSGTTRLKDMVSSIRSKATAKRALFTTTLNLGPGLAIGVKGYMMFKKETKGRSHYIYSSSEKAQIVKGNTTLLSTTTAQVLDKKELRKAYKFGGTQIPFTDDELKAIRKFGDPAITIIGFKPAAAALDFDHNVKPATFLYPDERDFVGSIRTFTALHKALVAADKAALVWAITRRNAAPTMAVLYPSLEPTGLFMMPLPFADDVRANPETSNRRAPPALIDRMRAVVKQLHMPKGYEPEKYENPSLQWHYRILQAIALEEDLPEYPVDRTLPKYKLIQKHAGDLVREWGETLQDVAGAQPKGSKRAKEDDDDDDGIDEKPPPAAKKAKTSSGGGGGGEVDFRAAYDKGQLGKLTVAVLKEWMKTVGLDTAGKKADLVERCEEYFDAK